MDMHELVRQMERAEKIWPDERPWTIHVLAGYLHIQSQELLNFFRQINSTLESDKDQVMPEDLRVLRAYCERIIEKNAMENSEDKKKEQISARQKIHKYIPKISEMIGSKEHIKALNTFIHLLDESGDYATPEEKAHWFEEMGRLSLKIKKHPNVAANYFKSAVAALSVLEDADGIRDLLETYDEEFRGDEARNSWEIVATVGQESINKLSYSLSS